MESKKPWIPWIVKRYSADTTSKKKQEERLNAVQYAWRPDCITTIRVDFHGQRLFGKNNDGKDFIWLRKAAQVRVSWPSPRKYELISADPG